MRRKGPYIVAAGEERFEPFTPVTHPGGVGTCMLNSAESAPSKIMPYEISKHFWCFISWRLLTFHDEYKQWVTYMLFHYLLSRDASAKILLSEGVEQRLASFGCKESLVLKVDVCKYIRLPSGAS